MTDSPAALANREIADAVGAHCILFAGGHHAREHLESLGVPVVASLREIPALVAGERMLA